VKLEKDGDYHLVIQGASGETMIAEIPTPTVTFVGTSPWIKNMKAARKVIDTKVVAHLNPQDFVPMGRMLVPRAALSVDVEEETPLPESFAPRRLDEEQSEWSIDLPAFKSAIPPTSVRITGVGFFDKVHGQMGVAQSNGIELHPVLKIELI